jgi:hypothetical protein
MPVPRDTTGRQLEVGQTVVIDCEPHNELSGKVDETFGHNGFVMVKYPTSKAICWPPALRILDAAPKARKPNLKERMLKRRKR